MSSHQPFNTIAGVAPSGSSLSLAASVAAGVSTGGTTSIAQQIAIGDVQHIHHLSDHIGALFQNDEYSDVTLVVQGQRFDAHRVILAARSEYFRALLYGGMLESQMREIELKDTPLNAFKNLLKYIYTGQINLSCFKEDIILEILGLAHQYGFLDLESAISDYLRAILSIENVCLIYDTAALFQLSPLISSCCQFMDKHATEIIKHPAFNTLSASGIHAVLSRDSFCAPEVEIFQSVCRWVEANPDQNADTSLIFSAVRLSLMSIKELLNVVRPTGLVQPDVMLDAIQSKTQSRDMELKYRGYLIPEDNVAHPKHGAHVLEGEVKQALLDGDSKNYDMERGFSRHPINDDSHSSDKGLVIKLGMQCIINHIKMLLWDRDQRAYSYYIDVSMDQHDWVRVIDHTKYACRSWQSLYFSPRVVRFIRVVGTHNTVNKVFHLVTLEAYYTKKQFHLDRNGILVPRQNVATIPMSACVIEGVCRSRNALLNGDTNNYDWDSGYTCHQLGSGAIVVQLGQPYALDTMRLLLWDCDDRSYSYYVEVSSNQRDWEIVCDRSRENCKSWQTIRFPRRPVVYIKIVGTHNTANEVFHCVHFECPASNVAPSEPSPVTSQVVQFAEGSTTLASSSSSTSSRSSVQSSEDHNNSLLAAGASANSMNRRRSRGSQWPTMEEENLAEDQNNAGAVGGVDFLAGDMDHFHLAPVSPPVLPSQNQQSRAFGHFSPRRENRNDSN